MILKNMEKKKHGRIDFNVLLKEFWRHRKTFIIVWIVVFILSVAWIFPQPRYYRCEVKLAPENASQSAGGLSSIASTFGINLNDMDNPDAISPMLYPELFTSPEFLVDVLGIEVTPDDGRVTTDYYSYLKFHQKEVWYAEMLKNVFGNKRNEDDTADHAKDLKPSYLSKKDYNLIKEQLPKLIRCSIDKKTHVISITVEDQDKLVCTELADSISVRLQAYIIDYRTKKARQDMNYYKHLTDSAQIEYESAIGSYSGYLDHNRKATRYTTIEKGKQLGNDLATKLHQYNLFNTQYQAMKAKVQEATPAFTTLTSATVPQKPAGPKRMLFVLTMLILSTMVTMAWKMHKEIVEWF